MGKLLKLSRIRAGLSQKDIASILKVTNQFICNVEAGLVHLPVHKLKKLNSFVSREAAIKASLKDYKKEWLKSYESE